MLGFQQLYTAVLPSVLSVQTGLWIHQPLTGGQLQITLLYNYGLISRTILNIFVWIRNKWMSEHSGSVVLCLIRDRGAAGLSLTGVTVLCPWARQIYPCLVLVQPRMTLPNITEKLFTGTKRIKQTKRNKWLSTFTKRTHVHSNKHTWKMRLRFHHVIYKYKMLHGGSYMSAHILYNWLNKLRKEIKCDACWAFYHFFATNLINPILQVYLLNIYLTYGIKITSKSHFNHLVRKVFYGRHSLTLLNM